MKDKISTSGEWCGNIRSAEFRDSNQRRLDLQLFCSSTAQI